MVIPKIQQYTEEQLKLGKAETDIKTELRTVGWNDKDIEDSIKTVIEKGVKIPKKKKKGKFGKFLLFLLFFVGLGSAGAFYYAESQPIYILNKAYIASKNIKSSEFKTTSKIRVENIKSFLAILNGDPLNEEVADSFELEMQADGLFDITTLEVPELSVELKSDLSNIISDAGIANFSYIYKLGTSYFNIDELNNFEAIDIDPYIGQWISTSVPIPGYVSEENIFGYQFSLEEQYFMNQKSEELGFIKLERTSSSELIRNSSVHTIKYTIDLTKAPEFYEFVRGYKPELPEMSEEQKISLNNAENVFLEPISGKIYISKINFYPLRLTTHLKIKQGAVTTTLDMEVDILNQNKPVEITIPTETLPWEQIKKELDAQIEAAKLGTDATIPAGAAQAFARDQQRNLDLEKIVQGLKDFLDKNGAVSLLFTSCSDSKQEIGTTPGHMDLKAFLVPEFMYTLPKDPVSGTDENTGYALCLEDSKKVNVLALDGETDMPLSLYFDMPE